MKVVYSPAIAAHDHVDTWFIPVFEPAEKASAFTDVFAGHAAVLANLRETGAFTGKAETSFSLPACEASGARFATFIGLGKKPECTSETARKAFASAIKTIPSRGFATIAVDRSALNAGLLRGALEGMALASYCFNKYLTGESATTDAPKLSKVIVIGLAEASDAAMAVEVEAAGKWVAYARDLSNEPANVLNPVTFCEAGRALAHELGVEFGCIEGIALREKGLNSMYSVGMGSATPPCLFWLRYTGKPGAPRLALVGKGLTFDSGGICIKGAEGMWTMKSDMAGAASVLGAFGMIASLHLPVNVDAVVGAAENMPSGFAYRPGDILKTYNGLTIEVLNTDAEGRLVLVDALAYAVRDLKADAVIDVATLTGAACVALGNVCTAVFANDEKMWDRVLKASAETDEKIWRLPLYPEYAALIKSKVADLKNIGGPVGGAITAAKILERFVEEKPWLHLDVAPTALPGAAETTPSYSPAGPTGAMVRTLFAFGRGFADFS
ncbi:MAG: leucyl aminopeptidase [Candidatus Brocadiia bacterium]